VAEPVFRAAGEADIPELRRIASAAWRPIFEHFREMMGDDLYQRERAGRPPSAKADEVESHFRSHGQWAFVTELGGKVVGFCTYRLSENGVGSIGNNAIDPAYQGRGLGTAQCKECLRRLREAGMTYAQVQTGLDDSHAPARRMYEKAGFEAIRPHVEYYMEL
jgi:ribosomal protein S18 acetylase RimI-like enzyme